MMTRALLCSVCTTIFLIAGCANKSGARGINTDYSTESEYKTSVWAGRISLQIQSEPTQAFFAGFELKGRPDAGELTLISPLGSILGTMRWSPAEATLEQAGTVRRFATTDQLLVNVVGAPLPILALFDWLEGKNTPAFGWQADLSQHGNGRITAQRLSPAPLADLRVVLDK